MPPNSPPAAKSRGTKSQPVRSPRGIEADFDPENADTFHRDFRADYVLATPRFNDSDCFSKDDDVGRKNFSHRDTGGNFVLGFLPGCGQYLARL